MELRYKDEGHATALVVAAQEYFQTRSIPTKVKACANYNVEEIISLAGIAAFTITPSDLQKLASTSLPQDFEQTPNLLGASAMNGKALIASPTYVNEEGRYRVDFSARDGGLAQYKFLQVRAYIPRPILLELIWTRGFVHIL
jgi:transaldolase